MVTRPVAATASASVAETPCHQNITKLLLSYGGLLLRIIKANIVNRETAR